MRALQRLAWTALLLLGANACGPLEQPASPELADAAETALRLFEVAGQDEPDEQALAGLFAAEEDPARRAALFDALAALGRPEAPRVVALQELVGLDRVAVDLVAELRGGGAADYSVQLERTREGQWRVAWFQGPGVAWPRRARPRGEGLSTSPPPRGDGL